jgi:5-methylcytosine-specific restriction protein A
MVLRSKEFWLIGFFISKYGNTNDGKKTTPPVELNTLKWKDAYKIFYNKFGKGRPIKTFENSLKNCRDTFDGHIENSGRKGWRELNRKPIKLPPLAKSVFNKYNSLSRELIWEEINFMLLSFNDESAIAKTKSIIKKNKDFVKNKKIKNPLWTRDELILALDLYFKLSYGQMDGSNLEVIELSEILNKLPIYDKKPDKETFRSVNNYLKLIYYEFRDNRKSSKNPPAENR